MATTAADGDDLDDILDQALDDLEQADIRVTGEEPKKETVASPSVAPSSGLAMDPNELFQFLTGNDNGPDGDEGDAKLDQFMKHLQSTMKDAETNTKNATSSTKGPQATRKVPSADNTDDNTEDVAATLASILEQMTTMDRDDFDDDAFAAGGLNPDAIVDGMMEQLLSKDLMYEPMKHVADQFPAWLEEKKESLSKAELAKYQRQYECFKELVEQYETDPSDTERLMKLMQDAQEFGQPPEEIVKAIAPGLELDSDGMPKINPLEGFGEPGDCAQM